MDHFNSRIHYLESETGLLKECTSSMALRLHQLESRSNEELLVAQQEIVLLKSVVKSLQAQLSGLTSAMLSSSTTGSSTKSQKNAVDTVSLNKL